MCSWAPRAGLKPYKGDNCWLLKRLCKHCHKRRKQLCLLYQAQRCLLFCACPTHTLSQPIVHSFHSCLISKCCCVRCIISSPSDRCNFVPFASPFHSLHHFKSVLFAVSFQVRSFRCIISSLFYSLYRYHFKFISFAIVRCIHSLHHFKFTAFCCIISRSLHSLYTEHVIQMLRALLWSSEESHKETYSGWW